MVISVLIKKIFIFRLILIIFLFIIYFSYQKDGKSTIFLWGETFKLAKGILDPSFGKNGILLIQSNLNYENHFSSIIPQNDEKILVGGYQGLYPNFDMIVLRYKINGQLDTTFGKNGIVKINLNIADFLHSMLLQKDHKILIIGTTRKDEENNKVVVLRYNSNGTLDYKFGKKGIVEVGSITSLISDENSPFLLQLDGKILIAGYNENEEKKEIIIQRLNQNGTLDVSFSEKGILRITKKELILKSFFLKPDGKILLVLEKWNNNSESQIDIFQYNNEGNLDLSFGENGILRLKTLCMECPNNVILQPDGKILYQFLKNIEENKVINITRYNANGSIDTNFGKNGSIELNILQTVMVLKEDKILTTGFLDNQVILFRYNLDGTFDSSFGNQGKVFVGLKSNDFIITSTMVQPDGKILVNCFKQEGVSWNLFAIIRLK